MSNTIYLRTLKRADHTVFAVDSGQKTYYDPQFRKRLPYASGQQVKRCVIEAINDALDTAGSPTTFIFDLNKKKEIGEGEAYGTCNPRDTDQLLAGWMKAPKGGKERTLKRRSPLSVSAMRPIHPLMGQTTRENLTYDRSRHPANNIVVRDVNGQPMDDVAIAELLQGKDRSLNRKWIPDNARATGLFVQDIAIDLRRLYTVSLNPMEPEISEQTEKQLREEGWAEVETVFGKALQAPAKMRVQVAEALATALLDWRITSNQSRTFSLMETLAVAISPSARNIGTSIRAELAGFDDEDQPRSVNVIIEEGLNSVKSFVSPVAKGYVFANSYSATALDRAESCLSSLLSGASFVDACRDLERAAD